MAQYSAEVIWERGDAAFTDNRYSRRHRWRFDGGLEVPGSSSPHSVPVPLSDPTAADPEEALIAALSSCHMLWFLAIAGKRKFRVDRYRDQATGVLSKNAAGKYFVSTVTMHPEVQFSGDSLPTREQVEAMHHSAHEECYIANSVITQIAIEPVWTASTAQ
ncbi:MAG TPA: OsmC family protein [Steroidobacteraceae bacterium]|jgi:organic hydroperoxide reductase OsmC/OhrA